MSMSVSFPDSWNFKEYEPQIRDFWDREKFFTSPYPCFEVSPFTLLMPPPNVTSQLHMGHGTGYSLQDWMVRYHRMCGGGRWIPGLDHAGIATQMMVELELAREGLTKQDLGREAFVERVQEWKEGYGGKILEQFRAMGFSCDWQRLTYTLDPEHSQAVRYAFVQLFREGLVYRGQRLVNWDPQLQTALSDDEIVSEKISGFLYKIAYVSVESEEDFLVVETTRPETMLGDTAVAVHPEDPRYHTWIGRQVRVPLTDRVVPVIADDYVKMEFGSGALKITPAHDVNDYEVGQRHGLPMITIFDERACIVGQGPDSVRGLPREQARKKVIALLEEQNLYLGKTPHVFAAPHSERSKALIEPRLCPQWYVKMETLAAPVASAAREGRIQFFPELWKKTWLHWLDNIQDWCISRQLWWGHRIPVWHCQNCGHVFASLEDHPAHCERCQHPHLEQDPDVLDTWFSSWLWPLSPFGWPKSDNELRAFFPSTVLVTAPEIIFQWVARMCMAALKFQGQLPFQQVYFNATVCDKKGRKFSKTLGNGIDPLDVIECYGADALRYTAAALAPTGGRIKMEMKDFTLGRNFINKLWNAGRYLHSHLGLYPQDLSSLEDLTLTVWQQGLLHEVQLSARSIHAAMATYRMHDAHQAMYHLLWNAVCDWGIEASKFVFDGSGSVEGDGPVEGEAALSDRATSLSVLVYVWECTLRLLQPLMPFVTEKLWQLLPPHPDLPRPKALCVSSYPGTESLPLRSFAKEHGLWLYIQEVVSVIRRLMQTSSVGSSLSGQEQKLAVMLVPTRGSAMDFGALSRQSLLIQKLAGCGVVAVHQQPLAVVPAHSLVSVGTHYEIIIPVPAHLQMDEVRVRFQQQHDQVLQHLQRTEKRLQQPHFLAKAPANIIGDTRRLVQSLKEQQLSMEKTLKSFDSASS